MNDYVNDKVACRPIPLPRIPLPHIPLPSPDKDRSASAKYVGGKPEKTEEVLNQVLDEGLGCARGLHLRKCSAYSILLVTGGQRLIRYRNQPSVRYRTLCVENTIQNLFVLPLPSRT